MSGDSYSSCPRCGIMAGRFASALQEKIDAFYGQVSATQYRLIQKKAKKIENPYKGSTSLREDYEINVSDQGVLTFSYFGCCSTCGYEINGDFRTETDPMPNTARAEDAAHEAFQETIGEEQA